VHGLRVHRLAHILCRADPGHTRQAELDVHLGDHPHRRADVGDVDALAGHLSRLGVERERAPVVIRALEVDLSTGAPKLLERLLTREPDRACRHPGEA
jgi:hypothetical protein